MSRRHNLRSVSEVNDILRQREKIEAPDIPSEDEEDHAEAWSGSEDEEEDAEPEVPDENNAPPEKRAKRRRSATAGGESSNSGRRSNILRGKNGHQWYRTARQRSVSRSNTPVSFLPGPIGEARQLKTPLDFWSLLFPDSMIEEIVLHTNEEIGRYRDSIEIDSDRDRTYSNVEMIEMKAYFGLLYFSGVQKTSQTSVEDLWNPVYGSIMYRSTMSRNRFWFISKNIRFDDKTTRIERRKTDKFAPIREVWEQLLSNCKKYYNPDSYCTIDEQLICFRGRCPFKVYNGSKPDNYGIKIVMLNDARTFYMYTAEPYVGKVTTADRAESVPSYYIRKLSEPLHGSHRNITCDNWFSSVPIFHKMLSEHSITMVGTLGKNEGEIPDEFKRAESVSTSKFAFDGKMTLVSHTPKKNKILLLISTFHDNDAIHSETKKPEIIHFYNTTKGGTDTFHQLCHEYSTARKTLRWPMRIWMAMLDQGGVNAMILHNFNSAVSPTKRKEFLINLSQALVEPHLRARLKLPILRRDLRFNIQKILEEDARPVAQHFDKRQARCGLCPRSKDRKSHSHCVKCRRAMCGEHKFLFCTDCGAID